MDSARNDHGWWPYWAPLFSFLLLLSFAARFGERGAAFVLPVQVLLPAACFAWFWRRGAYPELRGAAHWRAAPLALDFALGAVAGLLWMLPYLFFPALRPEPGSGFDAALWGESLRPLALALRLLGYACVTPIVEELFMRSWLLRYAHVFDRPIDFRDVPLAHYSRRSLAILALFFTLGHQPWEWPVALVWLLATTAWFYRRKSLPGLIVLHAGSNLAIYASVVFGSAHWNDWSGETGGLWFFL